MSEQHARRYSESNAWSNLVVRVSRPPRQLLVNGETGKLDFSLPGRLLLGLLRNFDNLSQKSTLRVSKDRTPFRCGNIPARRSHATHIRYL